MIYIHARNVDALVVTLFLFIFIIFFFIFFFAFILEVYTLGTKYIQLAFGLQLVDIILEIPDLTSACVCDYICSFVCLRMFVWRLCV